MAWKLEESLKGYAGDARVYKNEGGRCVMVSRANTLDRGDETGIFEWNAKYGRVTNWAELYFGYGESHEEALSNWGE